jgi:catechol 2,3-dioxygenase-like lactoylglutathione lyase family enzyme
MKFRSNRCVAIHLPNLANAERFYSDVLGLELLSKSRTQLEYNTGTLRLSVNKAAETQPPVRSFTVKNTPAAKAHLQRHACRIVKDWGRALYFRDPFGLTWDVIDR